MTPRLKGRNCKFFKTRLSRNSSKRLEHKENQTKHRKMTREPRSLVTILIYRTWVIRSYAKFSVDSLHRLNDTRAPRRLITQRKFVSPMSLLLLLSTVTCALRRSNRLVQKMLSLNWRTSKTLLRYE